MPLRIDRIKVNRGGPLESDFDFEPGDLNLIYGQNETGKTYVVESLIRFLFRTSGRSSVDWDLREWDIAGRAIVSGLEKDRISFSKLGEKLEDYWGDGTAFPRDLSRLLVVRAGETLLAKEKDGVGRDLLKDYLSGEGLLDGVAGNISATLQKAVIQGSRIVGNQAGELKSREKCEEGLGRVQILLDAAEEGYACGDAYALRQKNGKLHAQVEVLENGKRYHAGQLAARIKSVRSERREFPSDEELGTVEMDVRDYESARTTIDTKSERLQDLESTSGDYRWAQQARGIYEKITSGPSGSGPKPILIVVALLLLVGMVVSGLFGLTTPLITSAVGLVAVVGYYISEMNKALSRVGAGAELEKLKGEYRTRFGSELTDRAALQAKLEHLKENYILATPLRKEVDDLVQTAQAHQARITSTLKAWTGIEHSDNEWRDAIRELKGKIGDIEERVGTLEGNLASGGVSEENYLEQDPGKDWDPELYAALTGELESSEHALSEQESELKQLKARVSQETDSESSDWEELITLLRDKRDEAAQEYRQLTAEILAKIQVNTVIQEFRQEEDSRIAEGLKREELTEPLYALTGRYRSIRLNAHQGLVLVSDKDEEYPLASMSTGVREQVFLALRLGFASIAMEGKAGFLILDDAFQHSDWNRRDNLVDRTLSFVQSGWQVFYFTMDDHIRDLFQDAGERIGDSFRSHRLG